MIDKRERPITIICDACGKKIIEDELSVLVGIDDEAYDICPECAKRLFNRTNDKSEGKEPIKPPLGLRPKFVADEQRRAEIIAAIHRYGEVGKAIPQEWIDEYNSLCEVNNG